MFPFSGRSKILASQPGVRAGKWCAIYRSNLRYLPRYGKKTAVVSYWLSWLPYAYNLLGSIGCFGMRCCSFHFSSPHRIEDSKDNRGTAVRSQELSVMILPDKFISAGFHQTHNKFPIWMVPLPRSEVQALQINILSTVK